MSEPVRLISSRHLEALEASRRRLRWTLGLVVCVAVALAVTAADRRGATDFLEAARLAEAGGTEAVQGEWMLSPVLQDPLYDQFLREFWLLRNDPDQRRYLIAQVLAAAAVHRVDPDLLFALIATESSFDADAVSPKGARGLGQMLFSTAQAVAPGAVRRPEDLHDVPRNLHATALHLRQLLTDGAGDLRWALRAYYAGAWDRNAQARDREQYVARVSTHYAYLKASRTFRHLNAAVADAGRPEVRPD